MDGLRPACSSMGQCCLVMLLGRFGTVTTEMPHLFTIVTLDSSGGNSLWSSPMAHKRLVILAVISSPSSIFVQHGAGHVGQV